MATTDNLGLTKPAVGSKSWGGDVNTNWDTLDDNLPLSKFDATAAPTVNDDSGDGYAPGSRWVDVTNDKAYVCLDASSGAAVWTEVTQSGGGSGETREVIYLRDQKTSGTGPGGLTGGTWNTRTLNTEVVDTGGHCSLSSNQFTLDAGTYEVFARANAYDCNDHKIRLRNTSDSSTTAVGSSARSGTSQDLITTESQLRGRFVIGSSKTFELQHYMTSSGQGGRATGSGEVEIYAEVWLYKVE